MKQAFNILLLACFLLGVAACGQKSEKEQPEIKEDTAAKKLLQGIWLDGDDEDNVVFRVKGDVKLVKTDDLSYLQQFSHEQPVTLNQNKLVKRDTVVNAGNEKLHLYVQVNPTTFKVYKSSYNDDGVEVDNVYHDNIVNVNIYQGSRKIFGRDFRKEDFKGQVPHEFLKQSILSDIVFRKVDADGVHYKVVLAMPDSSMSYQVEIIISLEGKMTIKKS